MTQCPRGHHAVLETSDQYGAWSRCWVCGWNDNGLQGNPPLSRPITEKGWERPDSIHNRLHRLPTGPTNYLPWRERERKAWDREIDGVQQENN